LDLILEAVMLGCKPTPTPSDPSIKLHAEGAFLPDPSSFFLSFRRLIARLLYLTNTKPDISFVV